MTDRYGAIHQAAYAALKNVLDPLDIATAIADGVEAGLCHVGSPIELPERQLVQRYVDAGEPDDTGWGIASHEWDDRIEREL